MLALTSAKTKNSKNGLCTCRQRVNETRRAEDAFDAFKLIWELTALLKMNPVCECVRMNDEKRHEIRTESYVPCVQ